MPNTVQLHLLNSKQIKAEMQGIPLANENSYRIIAGEENATIFSIVSKPTQYANATYTVEMVNSQGYGIPETDILDDSFVLPKGMAVAGYGYILIRAYATIEGVVETVPFQPLKVKVWNTLPDWKEEIPDVGDYATEDWVEQYVDTALSGKQNTLTFDNTPTSGSTNPVTSGGVYTALSGKVDKVQASSVVYTMNGSGQPSTKSYSTTNNGDVPIYRDSGSGTSQPNGYLVSHNPANDYHVATKNYVDSNLPVIKDWTV